MCEAGIQLTGYHAISKLQLNTVLWQERKYLEILNHVLLLGVELTAMIK